MTEPDDESMAERALVERVIGVGDSLTVGRFRFRSATRQWEWSDEVARMHGYEPGTVPTTDMLVSHKHPDDRDRVAAMITTVQDSGVFSSHHRIVDTQGQVRDVLVVSEPLADTDGTVIGTEGYYIDLSDTAAGYRREALDSTLPGLLEARVVIEQAKGALMLAYGVNADQAFRVLRWRSQETNVKLRAIAEHVVAELPTVARDEVRLRTRLDHVLLTAHEGAPIDTVG
ncbi:PAS and ANTAR domain-containing protein [Nocardia salmonicida]|jgi:PAS domain S-box-containing protein|uniref:PAS and ANTAR domain-containing protein n=1 Tax=Nocardia TaxID=1817 RepID=UPI00265B17C0|nr:PAS and ANTAR domain-containing protein [Nocardia sp. PE-7]WKG11622.1 PAS and ANTAR domain-containing protein [Nocardia sp. PE-7]